MKTLSLTQPWASLVAVGAKKIESRSWATPYRGPLAIHAAKAFPGWAKDACLSPRFSRPLALGGYGVRDRLLNPDAMALTGLIPLPLGAIVAVGQLVTCEKTERAAGRFGGWKYVYNDQEEDFVDFTPGRLAWFIDEVHRLPEPIPCRGALGLWDVPVEVEARIEEMIGKSVASGSRGEP